MNHVPCVVLDASATVLYTSAAHEARTGFELAESYQKKPSTLWGGHMARSTYQSFWQELERHAYAELTVQNRSKAGKVYIERLAVRAISADKTSDPIYLAVHADTQQTVCSGYSSALRSEWNTHKTIRPTLYSLLHELWLSPTKQRFAPRQSDAELILAAQKNPDSFSVLYTKYAPVVQQYFLRHGSSQMQSEELMQDVFERAFRSLMLFTPGFSSYKTYLLRIAHHRLVDVIRKDRYTTPLDSDHIHGEQNQKQNEARLFTHQLLRQLSPLDANILRAHYLDGKPFAQLASEFGLTVNAVKLRASRARQKLRNASEHD